MGGAAAPAPGFAERQTDTAEANEAVSRGWRALPGYERLPTVTLGNAPGGRKYAVPFKLSLPAPPGNIDDCRTGEGAETSWHYALMQAVDAAYKLYRGREYRGQLPRSANDLGAWLDDIRASSCPNAPNSQLFLSQMPSHLGSRSNLAAQVGWRGNIKGDLDVTQCPVLVCGGSGAMRYPHSNKGRPITDSVKHYGGWANMDSSIYAGGMAQHWAEDIKKWVDKSAAALMPEDDGTHKLPPPFSLLIFDDTRTRSSPTVRAAPTRGLWS